MILPTNAECRLCVSELLDEPCLTQWERDFIASNVTRTEFTDAQKQVCRDLMTRYEVT
jgi:hypothetical protein